MKTNLPLLAAVLGLAGCANVSFYSDAALQHEVGVPVRLGKPYLLVTTATEANKPVSAQVVVLPDFDSSQVLYAKRSGFIGSTELNLTWTNGAVTTLGAKADPKSDAFLTALTGAYKEIEAANKSGESRNPKGELPFQLYEIVYEHGIVKLRFVER